MQNDLRYQRKIVANSWRTVILNRKEMCLSESYIFYSFLPGEVKETQCRLWDWKEVAALSLWKSHWPGKKITGVQDYLNIKIWEYKMLERRRLLRIELCILCAFSPLEAFFKLQMIRQDQKEKVLPTVFMDWMTLSLRSQFSPDWSMCSMQSRYQLDFLWKLTNWFLSVHEHIKGQEEPKLTWRTTMLNILYYQTQIFIIKLQ